MSVSQQWASPRSTREGNGPVGRVLPASSQEVRASAGVPGAGGSRVDALPVRTGVLVLAPLTCPCASGLETPWEQAAATGQMIPCRWQRDK